MRPRTLPETLRDTHIGSIVIGQFIAAAVGGLLRALGEPLSFMAGSTLNWLALDVAHAGTNPYISYGWGFVPALGWTLNAMVLLAAAYLLAAWIYVPSKRMTQPERAARGRNHFEPNA